MSNNDEILSENDPTEQECAIFQASMAERIGAGEDLQNNPHMLTCKRCRELMSELETIVGVIRESFPMEVEPHDDLWSKIESKLALESDEPEEPKQEVRESRSDAPLEGGLALEGGVA
jgi:hypothetical protein